MVSYLRVLPAPGGSACLLNYYVDSATFLCLAFRTQCAENAPTYSLMKHWVNQQVFEWVLCGFS